MNGNDLTLDGSIAHCAMESHIAKVHTHTSYKFKGVNNFQKKGGSQQFGCNSGETHLASHRSKYFCGSSLTSDLEAAHFFSYHRDSFKSVFSSSEKKALVSGVQQRLTSSDKIDWTSLNISKKSEIECLMKFRNEFDPDINNGKWTKAEEKILLGAVDELHERNWCRIADALQRRTPIQCLQHYQLNFNKGLICPTEWSMEEEDILIEATSLYGTDRTWQHIANCLNGRAASQCFVRWKRINARGMKSGAWDDAEERLLVGAVMAHEKKLGGHGQGSGKRKRSTGDQSSLWQGVAKCVPLRDEVRCREKWSNVLDPSQNTSPFTAEEDAVIIQQASQSTTLHNYAATNGISWSHIASLLKGRTDAQCLRRWKDLSGPVQAKLYTECSKKRRAIIVPRHSRSKACKSSLDDCDYIPVLSSSTY